MRSLLNSDWKAGIDSVRRGKLRSFWTTLGIIIGVASVISVVAIGEGIKQQIAGQIHQFGDNFITVRPEEINTGSGTNNSVLSGLNVNAPITQQDISIVAGTPGVASSAPMTLVRGAVKGQNGIYKDGLVIGTTSDLPSLLNQSLAYGNFFNNGDENMAVIGQGASSSMFNSDVPLGQSFTFHGQTFIVSGIFNQFNTAPLSEQANLNNAIFIPNDVAEELTNSTAPTYEILARPTSTKQTAEVSSRIQKELSASHGGDSGLSVLSGNQNLASSNDILGLLTHLIAGVAAISLLVGGIGIMNVMLVSVAERTHEIGIRKAVGATNGQILSQFLIESTTLSLMGGVIGILLAYLIDLSLRLATNLQPAISWQIVALASGVSLLIGIIFGTVPAFKAARKAPIEALRTE